MKLHFYIARRYLFSFATMMMILGLIFVLLDMVESMRKFDATQTGLAEILELTLLHMPIWMYRIVPLIAILSTVCMFLSLSRSSEMVVTRAAGRSALVTLISPALSVFILGLILLAVGNPIAAATSKRYERLSAQYKGASASVSSISEEGVWLRQGSKDGQTVIHAVSSDLGGTRLRDVTFYSFSPEGTPTMRVQAALATLQPGRWALRSAKIWELGTVENPEREALTHPAYWIASNLTENQIRDSFGKPTGISIWDLPAFIDQLEGAGFSARAHQVWFQIELATPFFLVAMVLLGAGFTMRHTRFGRTGMMIMFALLLGFGAYFIRNFAQILGENGQTPILLAAWTPPIAVILLSLGILLHLEDG